MGKYDREMKATLYSFCSLKPIRKEYYEIKEIYDCMKKELMIETYVPDVIHQLEIIKNATPIVKDVLIEEYITQLNRNTYLADDIVKYCHSIVSSILYWISSKTNYSCEDAIQAIFEIYERKNLQYGDAWFKHGEIGICRDMGRKMLRLSNAHDNAGDLTNTYFDIINYCAFMIVYLNHKSRQ